MIFCAKVERMRFGLLLQMLVGFLLVLAPYFVHARAPKIKLNACELLVVKAEANYSHLHNPDFAMDEALRVYEQLEGKATEVRNSTPIHFFREQIPGAIHMLRQMDVSDEVSYTTITPYEVGPNGYCIGENPVREITTTKKQIKKLIEEGLQHYRDNSATLDWFPMYMLEVVALKHFVRVQDRGSNFLSTLGLAKGTLLKELKSGQYLHWPTPAGIRIRHFRDWHLGIKPLGYATELNAMFDFDGLTDDDYRLYEHDIQAHFLPKDFFPYKKEFTLVRNRMDIRIEFEPDFNQKSILRLIRYQRTHESRALYSYYVQMRKHGFAFVKQTFLDNPRIWSDPAFYMMKRMRDRRDFFSDTTDQLHMMSNTEFEQETQKALKTFEKIVLDVFESVEPR